LAVQILVEVLRSRMEYQMVPAAPSVPWTDPASAEALQRSVEGRSPEGPPAGGGAPGPGSGGGVVVGTGFGGEAAAGGWGAGDGRVAVEWALQPVMAMAAANTTVVMILAGRMANSPRSDTTL
jgi:hypothetical protein